MYITELIVQIEFILDKALVILLLATFVIMFILALYVLGQRWVRTVSQSVTLILLPMVTYVITSVISGDIALSLGMVGALSIVRFRNPVRSPLELVAYFQCIGLGICASVSVQWLVFLGFLGTAILGVLIAFQFLVKKQLNLDIFKASFAEGNQLSTLELKTKQPIDDLLKFEILISVVKSKEFVLYGFASSKSENLLQIYNDWESNEHVLSASLRLN